MASEPSIPKQAGVLQGEKNVLKTQGESSTADVGYTFPVHRARSLLLYMLASPLDVNHTDPD